MLKLNRRTFTLGLASLGAGLIAAPKAFAASDSFPVTVKHAFGETVFAEAPKRVITIGWITQDAVVALGVAPIGVPEQAWGGDDNKVLPWLTTALQEQGMAMPERLNFDTDIPYEQILSLQPDAILAFYSGLTKEQYERLSAIAPVAAYPDEPWSGQWQDITLATGKVLGKSEEAQALVDKTNALIVAAAAAHPEFKGKTFAFGSLWVGESNVNVYVRTDPRVQLVEQLGFTIAPGVAALPIDQGYIAKISYESLPTIEADILITLDEGDEASDALLQNPLFQRFRPVAEGHHLRMTDKSFVMATSAPSVIGIPWMLDRFVPELAALLT
jgi:iron complex transport system substrate-binding protein